MKMFLEGRWQAGATSLAVTNPFNGETIDDVPQGTTGDIDRALFDLETYLHNTQEEAGHQAIALRVLELKRLKN